MIPYPKEFLERVEGQLGGEYRAFLACLVNPPVHGLRLNPLKWVSRGLVDPGTYTRHQTPDTDALKGVLGGLVDPIPWAKHGYYYQEPARPGLHPFHDIGLYYLQEPSAMAVAALVDGKPGEWVADLCAAPGGKTTQLAADMGNEGFLLANEIHPARARILSQNVERMGIGNCLVTNEGLEKLADRFAGLFDRVLVDAPCSGEGMFRKDENARGEWSMDNVTRCAARQRDVLQQGAALVRDGGLLVYSTCTFSREENEEVAAWFLQTHPEFAAEDVAAAWVVAIRDSGDGMRHCAAKLSASVGSAAIRGLGNVIDRNGDGEAAKLRGGGDPDGCGEQDGGEDVDAAKGKALGGAVCSMPGCLRLWPHRIKGEGHFAAVFRKSGSRWASDADSGAFHGGGEFYEDSGRISGTPRDNVMGSAKPGTGEEISEARQKMGFSQKRDGRLSACDMPDFMAFCKDVLVAGEADRVAGQPLLLFGDQLYLPPDGMPDIRGLKVLRPGLHLGTLKKNRFEPSHAWALALHMERVRRCVNLDPLSDIAKKYLMGETLGWEMVPGETSDRHMMGETLGWEMMPGETSDSHLAGEPLTWGRAPKGTADIHLTGGPLTCGISDNASASRSEPARNKAKNGKMAKDRGEVCENDGWTLVCFGGFGAGWAKSSHGVLKNHYPKGLRRNE
ncbi:MAG: RsmB/NOP family class I SAM-dependent RNA methyltransferase [Lachnospiraceae bacterium]|jgi:16S rRNA C967 or C1407 C5-methylase (RsmB/RsmF family)/NOL1/NOP2/fmu family ribosome biogenesis protein|nr:RsmB/NOP family class I SAM-dependent RNA methyltransferase [Lachnospiraceae bacterium]